MIPTSQLSAGRALLVILVARAIVGLLCPVEGCPQGRRSPDPGPARRIVSAIHVNGNERTLTAVIVREMESRVGRPYDPETVRRDRDRIDNLDLFSEVVVDTLGENGRVALHVRVRERLVWVPTAWIPYPILNWNEENGWSYGMGLTNPNSSGRNRSVSILAEAGGRRRAFFGYTDPWIAGDHGSVSVSLFLSESENFEGEMNRWRSLRVGLGSYLGRWGRIQVSVDGSRIETDPWRTASGTRTDDLRTLAGGFAYDTRDVYADPRCGTYVGGVLGLTGLALGGTVDYTACQLYLKAFRPTLPGQTVGTSLSVLLRDRRVPDYRRLRLGGVSAVRGVDPVRFKGRNRLVTSIEYRVAIKERRSYDFWLFRNVDLGLMVALFADAGAVWEGGTFPEWETLYGGLGAGLRVLSQQILRLEIAYSRVDGTRWIAATGMPF